MVWHVKLGGGVVAAWLALIPGVGTAATTVITCCEDAAGRRICADVLPPACYGRAYREINSRGTVLKVVPAPMTAEERVQAEQAEKARKFAEEKAKEDRRRDAALLQTYASLDDLDGQRQRAVSELERDLEVARLQEAEVMKRRAKLDQEAEFYVKKPKPPELTKAYRANDGELAAQRSVIESKQRDLDTVKVRYDGDRKRYAELQAQKARR